MLAEEEARECNGLYATLACTLSRTPDFPDFDLVHAYAFPPTSWDECQAGRVRPPLRDHLRVANLLSFCGQNSEYALTYRALLDAVANSLSPLFVMDAMVGGFGADTNYPTTGELTVLDSRPASYNPDQIELLCSLTASNIPMVIREVLPSVKENLDFTWMDGKINGNSNLELDAWIPRPVCARLMPGPVRGFFRVVGGATLEDLLAGSMDGSSTTSIAAVCNSCFKVFVEYLLEQTKEDDTSDEGYESG